MWKSRLTNYRAALRRLRINRQRSAIRSARRTAELDRYRLANPTSDRNDVRGLSVLCSLQSQRFSLLVLSRPPPPVSLSMYIYMYRFCCSFVLRSGRQSFRERRTIRRCIFVLNYPMKYSRLEDPTVYPTNAKSVLSSCTLMRANKCIIQELVIFICHR